MKVALTAYIASSSVGRCLELFAALPDALRPVQYTSNERRPRNGEQLISKEREFAEFIESSPAGFMLLARHCRYNFVLQQSQKYSIIHVDAGRADLTEDNGLVLLRTLCSADVAFAFIAEDKEYQHRNRIVRTFGANHLEAWVGRDLKKYFPGLYWFTVASWEECTKRAWETADIPDNCERLDMSRHHVAIKFYGHAGGWETKAEMIDNYCSTHECFFSKQKALRELNRTNDYETFCELLRHWQ